MFNAIIVEIEGYSAFTPAYYGMARALILLHHHTEALDHTKKGLDSASSYKTNNMTFPGTKTIIPECLSVEIEV